MSCRHPPITRRVCAASCLGASSVQAPRCRLMVVSNWTLATASCRCRSSRPACPYRWRQSAFSRRASLAASRRSVARRHRALARGGKYPTNSGSLHFCKFDAPHAPQVKHLRGPCPSISLRYDTTCVASPRPRPRLRRQPPQPSHSDGELHLRRNSDGVILFAPDDPEDEPSHEQQDALQEDGDRGEHPQLLLRRLLPVLR